MGAMLFGMSQPSLAMFVDPDLYGAAMTGAVAIITAALAGYMGAGHADLRVIRNSGRSMPGSWQSDPVGPGVPLPLDPSEAHHDRIG